MLVPAGQQITATIISRENAILCGQSWVDKTFSRVSPEITIDWQQGDGDKLIPDQVICTSTGNAAEILTAERTALNFLQTLSATATQTAEYVGKISHTDSKILDTRKVYDF